MSAPLEIDRSVADEVLGAGAPTPRVSIVLGSGFGGVAGIVADAREVPYADIPVIPVPARPLLGHAGRLVLGRIGATDVAVFSGRVHRYQGVSALEAAFPARLAAAFGSEILIVTNASGGLSPALDPGDIVLIEDHLNLTDDSPLIGWPGPEGGVPFVGMRDAYDPDLRALAFEVATEQGILLHPGVYGGLTGPAFETPAEAEMFRKMGADVVGMSTVPEVIAARALGLRVLGFSLVANIAASVGLSHEEVLATAVAAEETTRRLLAALLERL